MKALIYLLPIISTLYSALTTMVLGLLALRLVLRLQHVITVDFIELVNKILLAFGCVLGAVYLKDLFDLWYPGFTYEQYAFYNRALGHYWWVYWGMLLLNLGAIQIFWIKSFRRNLYVTFAVCFLTTIGLWLERMVILWTSTQRDYLPSSWTYYSPTVTEVGVYAGAVLLVVMLLWFVGRKKS